MFNKNYDTVLFDYAYNQSCDEFVFTIMDELQMGAYQLAASSVALITAIAILNWITTYLTYLIQQE